MYNQFGESMNTHYDRYESHLSGGGATATAAAGAFFMGDDPVHRALHAITSRLDSGGIPYAVAGGMALVAHGYQRTTTDVDILLTAAGLAAAHEQLDGLGYVPPFPGSKHLRDTTTKVKIEFLVAGQYPGDGKPKPVAFPDPAEASIEIGGIRYLKLNTLLELKLASGISNAGRLKDLGDVQELIRILKLPLAVSEELSPYVRAKFQELWHGVHDSPDPDSL